MSHATGPCNALIVTSASSNASRSRAASFHTSRSISIKPRLHSSVPQHCTITSLSRVPAGEGRGCFPQNGQSGIAASSVMALFFLKPADAFAGPVDVAMLAGLGIRVLCDSQNRVACGPEPMLHVLKDYLCGAVVSVEREALHPLAPSSAALSRFISGEQRS